MFPLHSIYHSKLSRNLWKESETFLGVDFRDVVSAVYIIDNSFVVKNISLASRTPTVGINAKTYTSVPVDTKY